MKNYYLKIREKFIENILHGIKKHEYRLATPERRNIKVGDTLILISNQDENNYIKVTVKKVNIFRNWDTALNSYWGEDFKGIYSTYEDVLKECFRYYSKEEVDQYGIIVFDIEPIVINYCSSSILLDTNIIIKRESYNNVSFEIAKLFNWFDKEKVKRYIHALSREELSSYGKDKDKQVMLTKLASYNILPDFSQCEDEFFDRVIKRYSQDKNGKVDNALLKEVYDDNVGILITDDKLILQKAEALYIRDRVLTSAELLEKFENTYPSHIEYKMLAVKLKPLSQIDLSNSFFNTLREDYGGRDFDNWFKKKAAQEEKAYVFENDNGLQGFLYLKIEGLEENYSDINPIFSPKKRLKVGTFKVNSSGIRLGERFIRIIFDNAIKFHVDEVYVTLFENKRENVIALKKLMEQWGFQKYGYKNNGELVLVKAMDKYCSDRDPKFNYPILRKDCNYFFLPIYPQYHTDLFPDNILQNENMRLYEDNLAHRYAIEKIYLTGAYNIKANPGDVVLIYRTGERMPKRFSSVISGIAIVEEVLFPENADECVKLCKDRSIFEENSIRILYQNYKTIVKLLDYQAFKNKVILDDLRQNGIVSWDGGPRPFTPLSKEHFDIIYKLGMEEQ